MSVVLALRKELGLASERVLRWERAVRDNPELPSAEANLESAVRIRDKLITQFNEATAKAGYDIFTYRAFDDDNRPYAAGAFKVIADFQTLVSVVHDALASGRQKLKATYSQETARETAFGFGYALVGSLEVVLTTYSQQLLFDGSPLDQTFGEVFTITQAKTPEEILEHARVLGPGPINALYEWVKETKKQRLGAEITWKKGEVVKANAVIQTQEVSRLGAVIADTTAKSVVPVTLTGTLIAADLDTYRFKLRLAPGAKPIKGWFKPGVISLKQKASLPQEYTARLESTVVTQFRSAKQKTTYQLLELLPPQRKSGSE